MPSRPPVLTRRVVVGALLLSTAGCSLDDLDPTSEDPTAEPLGPPDATASDEPTAEPEEPDDSALVTEVLAALALAHRTARAGARFHRGVAPTLRRFEELHATHAAELGDLPRTTGRVADPAESDAAALARVDRTEARLQRTLVVAATAAGSGALAQTLASMAAGTAQLRTTLAPGSAR